LADARIAQVSTPPDRMMQRSAGGVRAAIASSADANSVRNIELARGKDMCGVVVVVLSAPQNKKLGVRFFR
jgi:hypothetical protein